MEFVIAYGLPAAGKTTLLKSLEGVFLDLDAPDRRHQVKKTIANLEDGKYILDTMIFRPNKFISSLFKEYPEAKINIYVFKENRGLSILRDKERGRQKLCTKLINEMKLKKITPRDNLEIIEV
jgi:energy-coupling factor transporter ATP-binding protein EcfA2